MKHQLFDGEKIIYEPKDIYFDYDQSVLKSESESELTRLVNYLKENPDVTVKLVGHTDPKGSNDYNMSLSQRRVQSAKDYLVSKGIQSRRIQMLFEGEKAANSNSLPDWKNRKSEY